MRTFNVNGAACCFNGSAFRSMMENAGRERRRSRGQMMSDLAEKLRVSEDAVAKWKSGANGPIDLETVRQIADFLEVEPALLLRESERSGKMKPLTERQKTAAKRIYDVLIWFLEEYNNSDGFAHWQDGPGGGPLPEDLVFERVTRMEERVRLVLNREYFDLYGHEIYDDLCLFAGEELRDVYQGRIGGGAEPGPAAWKDYETARRRLNEIIERYV